MSKKWLLLIALVVVVIAAIWGGTALYAQSQNDKAPDALALSTPSAAGPTAAPDATAPAATSADLAGDWTVGAGSQAGYRVDEVLNGQDVTVVGRTDEVTGTVSVAGTSLSAADITVAMTQVTTDDSGRDKRFLDILQTTEHPTANFRLTAPVDIAAVESGVASVEAAGELTVAGVTAPVTVSLQAQRTAAGVEVSGTIPVTFADYGVTAPNLGFVKVEESGSIEMLLTLTR